MSEFKKYRRITNAEMRPYKEGECLEECIFVSKFDQENGSPKVGDMIERDPTNHDDTWLVPKDYYMSNFAEILE